MVLNVISVNLVVISIKNLFNDLKSMVVNQTYVSIE